MTAIDTFSGRGGLRKRTGFGREKSRFQFPALAPIVWFSVLLFLICVQKHCLSRNFVINFAMLIYLVSFSAILRGLYLHRSLAYVTVHEYPYYFTLIQIWQHLTIDGGLILDHGTRIHPLCCCHNALGANCANTPRFASTRILNVLRVWRDISHSLGETRDTSLTLFCTFIMHVNSDEI